MSRGIFFSDRSFAGNLEHDEYTRRHSKKMGCPVDREKPVRIVVANCRRKLREEIWRNRGIRLFWKEFIYLERNCKEIAENLLKNELLSSSL